MTMLSRIHHAYLLERRLLTILREMTKNVKLFPLYFAIMVQVGKNRITNDRRSLVILFLPTCTRT